MHQLFNPFPLAKHMIKAVNSKKKQARRKDFTVLFSCPPLLGLFFGEAGISKKQPFSAASFHPQGRHSPDQPDFLIQTKQEQGHRANRLYESQKTSKK